MRIEVDVVRADQSWDFDTRRHQSYLVVEICGIEVRAPCSEEELRQAIVELHQMVQADPDPGIDEGVVCEPPATFRQGSEEPAPLREEPTPITTAERKLAPLRQRGDDVGIAQG